MSNIALLKSTQLFSEISEDALDALAGVCEVTELHAGQALFYEGDDSDSLFLVKSGTVKIVKAGSEGDEDVAKIGSGSQLGEMTFLHESENGYEKRTATAEAIETTQLLKIPFSFLKKRVTEDAEFGRAFYRSIARNLSARIQKTDEDLVSLKSLRLRHV